MKNRMRNYLIIIQLIISVSVFSQGLINNNARLIVQGNSNLVITGNGNLSNTGTVTCNANSNVKFTGNTTQEINGSSPISFYNLLLDNTGAGLVLDLNINVQNNLTLNNGNLDMKNQLIDLGNTGTLINENSGNRLRSTSAYGVDGFGTGTIQATRTNPSGNVAGLGLDIAPSSALGNTVLIRGHERQAGSGSFAGNWSVLRYYEIQPSNNVDMDLDMTYFPAWELNGHTDGSLVMFQEAQYSWSGSLGPVYWEPLATTNTSPTADATSNVTALNYIRVTLGSEDLPLPVELSYFNISCDEKIKEINWETSSEINNDYFVIEKSYDGELFFELDRIPGSGNSNETNKYFSNDQDEAPAYYRLLQVDYDGTETRTEIIYSDCNEEDVPEFHYYQNESTLTLVFSNFNNGDTFYQLLDAKGRLIKSSYENFNEKTEIRINKSQLSGGIYYINILNSEIKTTDKIFVFN